MEDIKMRICILKTRRNLTFCSSTFFTIIGLINLSKCCNNMNNQNIMIFSYEIFVALLWAYLCDIHQEDIKNIQESNKISQKVLTIKK